MRRARAESFAALYDEHVERVYGFFGYRVSSREDAEDLTQATFERALKAWRRFDPRRASAATWLLAIARNLLIDHLRRQGGQKIHPLNLAEPDNATPELHTTDDPRLGLSPELERALATLSERDRELIALRFGADLTGPEIAEFTGLSLANVQQIISRSLRRLRAELETSHVPRGADRSGDTR
jgi:RNA polymerase sigma-70 factor (ECF subfamily)